MRKFKKVAAIVLAVAMICTTLFSFNVFAADSTLNLYYRLEASEVQNGQFTLSLYGADTADGTISATDGLYVALTQVELTFDPSIVTLENAGTRKNFYKSTTMNINNETGLVKLASMNLSGDEITTDPMAIFTCTIVDSTKDSVTFTPQNLVAKDGDANSLTSDQIHASALTVSLQGTTPTAAPTEAPTEAPTATPVVTEAPTEAPTTEPTTAPSTEPDVTADPNATTEPTTEPTATPSATYDPSALQLYVTSPSAKATPDTTVDVLEGATYTATIAWSPADDTFAYSTAYTATITVTPNEGTTLPTDAKAYVNNKEADVVFNDDGTATVTYTFAKTASRSTTGHTSNSGLSTGGSSTATADPNATEEPETITPAPVITAAPVVSNQVFTDVPSTYWGYDYIMTLYNAGIVSGAGDGTFLPENNVTRAEFTKMACEVFGLSTQSATTQFTDITATDWYFTYIVAATEAGIVNGTSEYTFSPNDNVTREQMAAIIGRYLDMTSEESVSYTDAADIEAYALPYVAGLSAQGLLQGDDYGAFNPKAYATRAEASALIARVMTLITPEATAEPTAEPEVTAEPEATADAEGLTTSTATAEPEATATAEPEATATAEAE